MSRGRFTRTSEWIAVSNPEVASIRDPKDILNSTLRRSIKEEILYHIEILHDFLLLIPTTKCIHSHTGYWHDLGVASRLRFLPAVLEARISRTFALSVYCSMG